MITVLPRLGAWEGTGRAGESGLGRFMLEGMMDYEILPVNAARLVEQGEARLIDVREPWEYSTAHVEGSVLIPMGEFAARAHQELDPEEHLLVLCHHGMRSLSVTNWLRQQGFERAQSVAGGIQAWSETVDAKVPRY